jgi:hypothetical protein
MAGEASGGVVRQVFRKVLVDLLRADVEAAARRGRSPVPSEATARFLGGGLLDLLLWWLEGRTRLGVEDMDGVFRRVALPALRAGAR